MGQVLESHQVVFNSTRLAGHAALQFWRPAGFLRCHRGAGAPLLLGLIAFAWASPGASCRTKEPASGDTEYRDPSFGVSFRLPEGWYVSDAGRWQDNGWRGPGISPSEPATTLTISERKSRKQNWDVSFRLYYRLFRDLSPMPPEEVDKLLESGIDDKIDQRRSQERLRNYHIRADSYRPREIGGWRALSFIAEFTQGHQVMAEYFVWVRSQRCLAQLFIRTRADRIEEVIDRVEPIVRSLRIP